MKIGRNVPCPCGSGEKYKDCCLGRKSLVRPLVSPYEIAWLEFLLQPLLQEERRKRTARSPVGRKLQDLIATGYDALRADKKRGWRKAISPWLEAWELLKPELRKACITDVEAIDDLFYLGEFALNWTQDLRDALENAAFRDPVYYPLVAKYTGEFVAYLPDSGLAALNMRCSHAEALYMSGEPERGEAVFRQLIRDHPGWAWGYVGFADVHWLYPDRLPVDYERALSIYREGLANNEDLEDAFIFKERLVELAETAGWPHDTIASDLLEVRRQREEADRRRRRAFGLTGL